VGIY